MSCRVTSGTTIEMPVPPAAATNITMNRPRYGLMYGANRSSDESGVGRANGGRNVG